MNYGQKEEDIVDFSFSQWKYLHKIIGFEDEWMDVKKVGKSIGLGFWPPHSVLSSK